MVGGRKKFFEREALRLVRDEMAFLSVREAKGA
jgi:hypothetical protein